MKNTSKTMYRVGNIFNLIELGLGALFFILGITLLIIGGFQGDGKITSTGGTFLGWGIYLVIFAVLCLIFVGKAQKELDDESKKSLSPYIVTIVFGVLAENPFYVVGGILGIIVESKQGNQEEPKQVEEKPEEEKKEQE